MPVPSSGRPPRAVAVNDGRCWWFLALATLTKLKVVRYESEQRAEKFCAKHLENHTGLCVLAVEASHIGKENHPMAAAVLFFCAQHCAEGVRYTFHALPNFLVVEG